jgi:hypothetical protein
MNAPDRPRRIPINGLIIEDETVHVEDDRVGFAVADRFPG